ncbi:unnamed protein product [Caenorhabditis angaria]|uniref:Uncharacterized protein n=1 Tax=Caenorhabditis angaria TaxID=860376 RepID=A0A9P1NA03_9PELO|nr:unnamed protein product [Caenorhabditis angaria]
MFSCRSVIWPVVPTILNHTTEPFSIVVFTTAPATCSSSRGDGRDLSGNRGIDQTSADEMPRGASQSQTSERGQ